MTTRTHTVRRGETLAGIARNAGVSLAELARANHIANPDRIAAGAVLTIPTVGAEPIDDAAAVAPPTRPTGRTIAAVPGLSATTAEFRRALVAVADSLAIDPDDLAAEISFETVGTFSPSIRNPSSGFVGLIQFGDQAARAMGTTRAELAKMSAAGQLLYVRRYFAAPPHARDLGDVAMRVFWPAAVGKPDTFRLFEAPSIAYEQNRALDREGKGYVTRGDYVAQVRARKAAAQGARLPVDVAGANGGAGGGAALLFAALATWHTLSGGHL